MSAKHKKSQEIDSDALINAASEVIHELILSLKGQAPGDGAHPAIVADVCRATTAAAQVAAEQRARQKLRLQALSAFSLESVADWFRGLPDADRALVLAGLQAVQDETTGSVLG